MVVDEAGKIIRGIGDHPARLPFIKDMAFVPGTILPTEVGTATTYPI
jgi:hypothetical protein